MVQICRLAQASAHAHEENTVALAIVRKLSTPIDGLRQCSVLSPSGPLLGMYNGWRSDPQWNDFEYRKMKFRTEYVPRFLTEIRNSREAHLKLAEIWEMDKQGKNIYLACFCPNEAICHRSIIAGLLSGLGVHVTTATGKTYEEYFRMLRRLPKPGFAK